ncbi:MAG: GAF domain-containing protein [Carbonactinosporaceae bacterium]
MPDDVLAAERAVHEVRSRIGALRDACAADPPPSFEGLLDVALDELDRVGDEMARMLDLLYAHAEPTPPALAERHREHDYVRQLFAETPVPVVVLAATGEIRRGNQAAAGLLELPLGYLTGKPLFAFLDPSTVAIARAKLAAVLRDGDRQSMDVRLRRSDGLLSVTFLLQPILGPGRGGPQVLAAVTSLTPLTPLTPLAPLHPRADHTAGREAQRSWRAAAALDLVLDCARLLLEASRRSSRDVAHLLAARLVVDFADWVIIDCLQGRASLARSVVAGGQDVLRGVLAGLDPDANLLARLVVQAGEPLLRAHLDDLTLLGALPDGRTALGAMGAGSVLGVPISHGGRLVGALCAVRAAGRGYFTLTDQRILGELAGLLGGCVGVRALA